jgi:hypothetical protein
MNKDTRINRTRPYPHKNQKGLGCKGGSPPPNSCSLSVKSFCKLCNEEIDGWTIKSEDLCGLMGFDPIFCFPGNLGKSSNPSLNPFESESYEEMVGVKQGFNQTRPGYRNIVDDKSMPYQRPPEFVKVPIFISWLNEELADVLLAACFKLFKDKGYVRLLPKIVFQLTFDSEEEIVSILKKKSKLINIAKAMKSNGHEFEFWIIDYTEQNPYRSDEWDYWPQIDWEIIG